MRARTNNNNISAVLESKIVTTNVGRGLAIINSTQPP